MFQPIISATSQGQRAVAAGPGTSIQSQPASDDPKGPPVRRWRRPDSARWSPVPPRRPCRASPQSSLHALLLWARARRRGVKTGSITQRCTCGRRRYRRMVNPPRFRRGGRQGGALRSDPLKFLLCEIKQTWETTGCKHRPCAWAQFRISCPRQPTLPPLRDDPSLHRLQISAYPTISRWGWT